MILKPFFYFSFLGVVVLRDRTALTADAQKQFLGVRLVILMLMVFVMGGPMCVCTYRNWERKSSPSPVRLTEASTAYKERTRARGLEVEAASQDKIGAAVNNNNDMTNATIIFMNGRNMAPASKDRGGREGAQDPLFLLSKPGLFPGLFFFLGVD